MRRTLIAILISSLATSVQAGECDGLGLDSEYLARYFCQSLKDLAETPGPGRGVLDEPNEAGAAGLPQWAEVEIIQDAYRADPRKTLELIKRIKGAGGLTSQ